MEVITFIGQKFYRFGNYIGFTTQVKKQQPPISVKIKGIEGEYSIDGSKNTLIYLGFTDGNSANDCEYGLSAENIKTAIKQFMDKKFDIKVRVANKIQASNAPLIRLGYINSGSSVGVVSE